MLSQPLVAGASPALWRKPGVAQVVERRSNTYDLQNPRRSLSSFWLNAEGTTCSSIAEHLSRKQNVAGAIPAIRESGKVSSPSSAKSFSRGYGSARENSVECQRDYMQQTVNL